MAAPTTQHVLAVGLTIARPSDVFRVEHEKATSQGFTLVTYETDVKAQSDDEILTTLSEKLREREYAAVTIGFGLRGDKDKTGLFEKIVNICVAEGRGAKLGFAVTPSDIVDAARRVLGGGPGASGSSL